MLHVLLLLGVIGFSDGHSDTFVPGSSVLHWDRSECISQKAASVAIVAYLPIFFFLPIILFHLNGGGACLKLLPHCSLRSKITVIVSNITCNPGL